MEKAVLAHRGAWQALGFTREPTPRRAIPCTRAGSRRDIPDLFGDGIVVELKRRASATDIEQPQRYVKASAALAELGEPVGPLRGVLVRGSEHPDEALLHAVGLAEPAIEPWSCGLATGRERASRLVR